jgi:hypothetical protein
MTLVARRIVQPVTLLLLVCLLSLTCPLKLLQEQLEADPTKGTDDEAIEVHGADHRSVARAGSGDEDR